MKFRQFCLVISLSLGIAAIQGKEAIGQTRFGLHFTQEEIDIWKQRAASGPYKGASDVSTNSPGDWTRIQSNATTFSNSPTADRWAGNTTGVCATGTTSSTATPGQARGDRIR